MPAVVVGGAVLSVVGGTVLAVVAVVAALLQETLQPLAPAPFFLPSLMNSTTMSEVEVNTNFFLFPQTSFSSVSVERTSLSPLLQFFLFLFLMLIFLQENFISAQVSSIR